MIVCEDGCKCRCHQRADTCSCGHSPFLHFITAKGERGRCSSWYNGRCPCRGYTTKEE